MSGVALALVERQAELHSRGLDDGEVVDVSGREHPVVDADLVDVATEQVDVPPGRLVAADLQWSGGVPGCGR